MARTISSKGLLADLWPGSPEGGGLHLASLERQFPSRLLAQSCGYIAAKRERLDAVFTTDAFSFILRGSGSYAYGGRTWKVRAPCVLTQRIGERFAYGPDTDWEEIWFVIDERSRDEVRHLGLLDPRQSLWYIGEPEPVLDLLRILLSWLRRRDEPGAADRIDRQLELLVIESLLRRSPGDLDERRLAIRSVRAALEGATQGDPDPVALAQAQGLAPATFRRWWQREVGVSPGKHLLRLRLTRACRLLVETDQAITAIAAQVGFADPLYFSRRFRFGMGISPSAYRERHQVWRRK